jgi:hypothetical protein
MHKHHLIALSAALLLGLSTIVHARGGGGMGSGHGPGGMSNSHISDRGLANSNAQFREGATRGQDRAALRRSEQGAAHQQATTRARPAKDKTDKPAAP